MKVEAGALFKIVAWTALEGDYVGAAAWCRFLTGRVASQLPTDGPLCLPLRAIRHAQFEF